MFPTNTLRTYLLHQLLASVKLPLDELACAHLAVLKVPPLTQHGFEQNLLRVVSKIRQVGPQVAILVLPQERRQAQTALWVHKWNRINHVPFVFVKTCVCRLGSTAPGFHFTVLLGKSYGTAGDFGICEHVPSSGCQQLVMQRCMSECMMSLSSILPGTISATAATLGTAQGSIGHHQRLAR